MIQITAQMRILVAVERVDFRVYAEYPVMQSCRLADRSRSCGTKDMDST